MKRLLTLAIAGAVALPQGRKLAVRLLTGLTGTWVGTPE